MTGEVTLQGRVLPIGGLKQKVLAAHAAGLTDVIIPERNRADLDDVPDDVRARDDVPPGDDARRGARARTRAGSRACAAVTAHRFPRRSASAAGLLERRWTVSIIWASHERRGPLQRVRAVAGLDSAGHADGAAERARAGRDPRAARRRRPSATHRVPPHSAGQRAARARHRSDRPRAGLSSRESLDRGRARTRCAGHNERDSIRRVRVGRQAGGQAQAAVRVRSRR